MVLPTKPRRGPKGLEPELHNAVVALAQQGVPAKDAIERTGVSQTKVYEIYRNPIPKLIAPEVPAK